MLSVRWRISSPATWALPFLQIFPVPCQLLGQSRVSPPFPCLGPWGCQGLERTRHILRAPRALGPAASCAVAGCEARGTGRAAGSGDGSRPLPGRRGTESDGEDRPRPVQPVLAGVGAWRTPWPKGSLHQSCARAGGFHGRCWPRWVPSAATCQVVSPKGKPGRLHPSGVTGSRAGGRLCEPVPQHCWPGKRAGWGRQAAAERACPRQALTCAQLVLALTHAPVGAEVPAVSRQHGPARVRRLAG